MKQILIANDIEILRLSPHPDTSGLIIPPEAETEFPKTLDIMYGEEDIEHRAGKAVLRREKDIVYANMVLFSDSSYTAGKTVSLISKLYPSIGFYVKEANHNLILRLEIFELFLTPHKNDDETIQPLGDRVYLKLKNKELN